MARPRRRHPALAGIDEAALAEFRAGIRRRYTDEQILGQLRASAERLGRSPTMREFASDPEAEVHPQTVIEHFGTWNAAERAAAQGAVLARDLGRLPKMADWKEARRRDPSLLSEWQVYRLVDIETGPWAAFQYLVRERLREEGIRVNADGSLPS